MCILRGCPLLIVTIAVAALLSGCGRTSLPAPSQRAPTMDVSIVVTVEFYDPDESAEVEEAPVVAEAPESGQPLVDLGTPAAKGTPAMVEAPAAAEPMADTNVPLAYETTAAPETRIAVAMRVAVTVPDFDERSRVFFVFDSAVIQDDQQAMIHEWGGWLKAHAGWALRIEGHTDRQGPCLYNRSITNNRY